MTDTVSIEQLIEDLRDDDWEVRYNAADQLKVVGDGRAVEPLIRVLNDDNMTVRFIAAMTLGIIKDPKAVPDLANMLRTNDDYDVLWAAAWALNEIGGLSAEPLIESLKVKSPLTRDIAADVLGRLGDERAIQPLAEVFVNHSLEDYPETGRFGAADALEKFGEAATDAFSAALTHDTPEVRARAALALGRIQSPRSVPAIVPLLQDETSLRAMIALPRVCDAAAQALEQIGGDEAMQSVKAWHMNQNA